MDRIGFMSIFRLERNIDEWTYRAYNAAGMRLSELMAINGGIGTDSFYWIKCEPSFPTFADFIFGYHEKVFAVAIIRVRIVNGHREIDSDYKGLELLEEVSRRNNFIPCIMPINQDLTFLLPGWGLMNPGFVTKGENLEMLRPEELGDDDERAEISEWELRNLASITIKEELKESNADIRGIMTLDTASSPEVIYYDGNGELNYVIVKYVVLPSTEVVLDDDVERIRRKMDAMKSRKAHGHFTIVGFKSSEPDGKLYRRKGISIAINSIVPIEDAEKEKGTEILSAFRSLIESSSADIS